MNWSKSDIRAARKIPLAPLLRQRGFSLQELPGENYRLNEFGDLIIKDCYWIWKSKNLHGNTIDFFVMVEKLSFADAMNLILGSPKLPSEGGSGSETHKIVIEHYPKLPS